MIHVYAVAAGLEGLPDVSGLGDAALDSMSVAGFDVVFSEVGDDLDMDEEAVLRHALVVDALMERSDALLPGRLGPRFADVADVVRAVEEQADTLHRAADRVAGCVEVGLRVLESPQQSQGSVPPSGSEYLRRRLEERRASVRQARELHEPLSRLVRASVAREGQAGGEVLEAAYLVPVDEVERFREKLARLEDAAGELRFVCTGPWPPYTFASVESG